MIDGPRSWPPKNTALVAQTKATQRVGGSLNTMAGRWSPHHHRTMRRAGHSSVQTKQQPKQSNIPTHPAVKSREKQLEGTLVTSTKTRRIEQGAQDRCTDHGDTPRPTMMVTHSDTTEPTTPGPNSVSGVRRRCFIVWPNIEEPHTLSASPTR